LEAASKLELASVQSTPPEKQKAGWHNRAKPALQI
jgi:hypothetical protein